MKNSGTNSQRNNRDESWFYRPISDWETMIGEYDHLEDNVRVQSIKKIVSYLDKISREFPVSGRHIYECNGVLNLHFSYLKKEIETGVKCHDLPENSVPFVK